MDLHLPDCEHFHQVISTPLSSLIHAIILQVEFDNYGYIASSKNFALDLLYTWGSWFISFSNFIPISLLVTVDLVRYGQGYLLSKDESCKSRMIYTEVQTSSVNEELGQIEYIMTDKTGTLTQNKMEFKCLCAANGVNYGALESDF